MEFKLNQIRPGVSTLLLPKDIFSKFNACRRKFGGTQGLFHYLARRNNPDIKKRHNSVKIKYQPKGRLIKVNFRPAPEDWELLRNIALSRRISMTYLFVLLLEGYLAGDVEGTPSQNISSELTRTLTISPKHPTLKINHRFHRKRAPC